MWTLLLPVLYGLFVWWFSTGVVLALVQRVGAAPRAAMAGAAVVLLLALAALRSGSGDASPFGAYAGFTAAILVWGVQEFAFLAGWITGPWRAASPEGVGAWGHTRYAIAAILYHELALLASGAAIVAVTWGGANQVGVWTFGVLFAMRISAKLNVFLGVPNITEGFLPPHLDHLKSFFCRKPMNLLFPVSVTVSTVALVLLALRAAEADGGMAAALGLIATLVALGLIEHWFLVLPLPVEALWAWSQRRAAVAAQGNETDPAQAPAPAAQVVHLDRHAKNRTAIRPGPIGRPGFSRKGSAAHATATGSE